ncbi:lysosome-associated membrane glycoprotein 3 isoform X2 [Anoplopoma fimbria]|uniref:lysosome-associated membrane glycoprotein 3 isoform X2 n=1 Tax=Anoplopoma fimbria TaxID=229290 RepID=UPI0023ED6329|nr:lysosome-associated membrane glycoprotein 3 isoform X2 [Anoplopoma fimbria]
MMQRGQTGGWFLFFLAAVISGVHLQGDDRSIQPASDSELPSEAQIYQPVLKPFESVPPIGTYMLKNLVGKPCVKATIGAEYIVIEKKKTWYFNLDPSRVRTSGYCDKEAAVLSLTLPDNAASLQFTFRKEESIFYIDKLTAHVSPLPVCQGCASKTTWREKNKNKNLRTQLMLLSLSYILFFPDKTYSGSLADEKLFAAGNGQSFKCQSEQLLWTSSELRIKLVPLQMQAFTLPIGQYGIEVECWPDFNKRVFPIIAGATVVGLILMAVLTFLFIRDRHREGYERL